jgi:hypothetical protein
MPGTYNLGGDEQGFLLDGGASTVTTIEAYDPGDKPIFSNGRFYVNGASYMRFRNLKFTAGNPDGIKVNADAHHIEFVGCEVYNNVQQGIIFTSDVGGTPSDIQIWDCRVYGNGSDVGLHHGIYIAANTGTGTVIANCIIYNNAAYGIQAYPNTDGVIITGCTIDQHPNKSSIVIGGDVSVATDNIRVVGCIFSRNGVYSVRVNWEGTPGTGNNVQDCVGDGSGSQTGEYQAGSGVTYTNCREDTNPVFTDVTSRDYTLQSGSLATAHVDPARYGYLPATDITGAPRTSATPGAYNR